MASTVRAGTLREQIQFQAPAAASDGMGGGPQSWTNHGDPCWARCEPLSGREITQGEREENRVRYRVVVRYRDDITGAMRILWGTRTMNIQSVLNDDERRQFLTIFAEEGRPN